MKIATIVGARPQFIKAAVVSRVMEHTKECREVLVHTGQHYDPDMSEVFFRELGIRRPDHYLGVGSGTHGEQTGRMLELLDPILLTERPDVVLVYGDTNSTLAGALSAVKLGIPVAHVEAGLRAYNRDMPEEVNRVVTDHVSSLLLAPSETSVRNLEKEGIATNRIKLVGDVMLDSAIHYGQIAERTSRILNVLGTKPKEYILCTVHRAENTDNISTLKSIVDAFVQISKTIRVIFPIHPRTRKVLAQSGLMSELERSVTVIAPVGYIDMVMLEKSAAVVASDSGGVPKEAFFHGVPSVILRKEAVWVELVDLGWASTADPSSTDSIVQAVLHHLKSGSGISAQPYGDGNAGRRIVEHLMSM